MSDLSEHAIAIEQVARDNARSLEYSKYARQYDSMCELIPAYQENIDFLTSRLASFELPGSPRVLDLGAGTGNYIAALHQHLPNASFVHLDADERMNEFARRKYDELPRANVEIVQDYMQRASFTEQEFDLVVSVNALNTAFPQTLMLRRMCSWLKRSGTLFLIDFGRRQRTFDWSWYIFSNTVKRYGLKKFVSALVENREGIAQNRKATKDQDSGLMWLHSHDQFLSAVQSAGFLVRESDVCYRGYCDRVVAGLTPLPSPNPDLHPGAGDS